MIKNFLASIAAAGLLVAPIAAQANTRAGEAGVSMEALARSAAPVGAAEYQGEDEDDGLPMWIVIALFLAAGGGIIAAIESGENNKSPGT